MPPSLPPELWDMVIAEIPIVDVKSVRQCCKTVAALGAIRLFHEVHIGYFRFSMESLAHIANHSTIQPLVRKLIVHQETLVKLSYQEWKTKISARDQWKRKDYLEYRREISQRQWRHNYNIYDTFRNEQLMLGGMPDVSSFQESISKLSGLQSVRDSDYIRGDPIWCHMEKLFFSRHKTPYWTDHMNFIESDSNEKADAAVGQVTCLLEGLSLRTERGCPNPVHDLDFSIKGNEFWFQKAHSDRDRISSEAQLTQMRLAFNNLTSLKCSVKYDRTLKIHYKDMHHIATNLAAFLRQSTCLESLDLRFERTDLLEHEVKEGYTDFDLLRYLRHAHWPRLKRLRLTIISRGDRFLKLFRTHSATLQDLILVKCRIEIGRGTWEGVLCELPEILELKSFELWSLTDEIYRSFCGTRGGYMDSYWPPCARKELVNFVLRHGPRPSFRQEDFLIESPDPHTITFDRSLL